MQSGVLDRETPAAAPEWDPRQALSLTDKVAVVTGATGDFGQAICRALGAAGARVIVVGRSAHRLHALTEVLGGEMRTIMGDVSRPDEADRIVDVAVTEWGALDILVNCTGGATVGGLLALDDATWRADLDGKFLAYLRMMRASARHMAARGGGRIVNVIGLAGHEPYHLLTIPSAINAALLAATKSAADELAPFGILVNAVNPNAAESGLGDRMIDELAAAQRATSQQVRDYLIGATPLRRLARPADVAKAVLFYASDLAAFLTGTSLTVDGGAHRAIA